MNQWYIIIGAAILFYHTRTHIHTRTYTHTHIRTRVAHKKFVLAVSKYIIRQKDSFKGNFYVFFKWILFMLKKIVYLKIFAKR